MQAPTYAGTSTQATGHRLLGTTAINQFNQFNQFRDACSPLQYTAVQFMALHHKANAIYCNEWHGRAGHGMAWICIVLYS
jgi:hypothetical protein